MKYLACDPGERKFAYSIVDIKDVGSDLTVRILASGYVQNTITNLTHNAEQRIGKFLHDPVEIELAGFGGEMDEILDRHKPQRIGSERFMMRRAGGAKTIESVSMMNGILLDRAVRRKIRWYLYGSQTWKNWVGRVGSDKTTGTKFIQELYRIGRIRTLEPHTVDTVLMSLWMFTQENPNVTVTQNKMRNAIRNTKVGSPNARGFIKTTSARGASQTPKTARPVAERSSVHQGRGSTRVRVLRVSR